MVLKYWIGLTAGRLPPLHELSGCQLLASNLNLALRELTPEQRGTVRVVAVSVDARGDTRAAVRRFVAEHRLLPQFRYLTGSKPELKPIWQAYNLLVEVGRSELVSRSAYVLLLDQKGKPRFLYLCTSGRPTCSAISVDCCARGSYRRRSLQAENPPGRLGTAS